MTIIAIRWADRDENDTTLPELPWNKPPAPWGSLNKKLENVSDFLKPLDMASDYYLNTLWRQKVEQTIINHNEQKALEKLDYATDFYLEALWKNLVEETKKKSEEGWTTVKTKKTNKKHKW